MMPQSLDDGTEQYKAQQNAARQRAAIRARTRPENILPEARRLAGGGSEDPISGAIRWLAEAAAQTARQKALKVRISNQDNYIALRECVAFSRTLCCISQEIIRESRDRIARITRE